MAKFKVGQQVVVTDYNSENAEENAKIRGKKGVVAANSDALDDFDFVEVELFGQVDGITTWLFYDDEIEAV